MSAIRGKLRSRRGETLVETLCSIMIATLACALLLSLLLAAANINAQARTANARFQTEQQAAEQQSGASAEGQVYISVRGVTERDEIEVDFYFAVPEGETPLTPDNQYLLSYSKKGGG